MGMTHRKVKKQREIPRWILYICRTSEVIVPYTFPVPWLRAPVHHTLRPPPCGYLDFLKRRSIELLASHFAQASTVLWREEMVSALFDSSRYVRVLTK